jgi:hypothetical protein
MANKIINMPIMLSRSGNSCQKTNPHIPAKIIAM